MVVRGKPPSRKQTFARLAQHHEDIVRAARDPGVGHDEYARKLGVSRDTLRLYRDQHGITWHIERSWRRGVSRPDLRPGRRIYNVGLSLRQWRPILDTAREHGVDAAAQQYDVPDGAIDALLRGRDELVD